MDGGAWQATVHGVTKSQTRLSDFTFVHKIIKYSLGGGQAERCGKWKCICAHVFIHSVSLCLLVAAFNPFTFKVASICMILLPFC